jgi:hypothetical protein
MIPMKNLIYITLFAVTAGMSSCVSRMASNINPESIPEGVQNTTLLIEEYQYKDPADLNSFGKTNIDSLEKATGFTYNAENIYVEDKPENDHPLIVETNENLKKYNKGLFSTLNYYKFPYTVVNDRNLVVMDYQMQGVDEENGTIGGMNENMAPVVERKCNSDIGQYQYALVRQPIPHCYIDPDGKAQESYRYEYFFQNLQTGENYPAINVYSSNPNKTLKAIIYKLNKNQKTNESSEVSMK